MIFKSILFVSLMFIFTSVNEPSQPPQITQKLKVITGEGELYQKWKISVEKKCSLETSVLVLAMFEAQQSQGNQMTEDDVNRLKNMLMFSCSKYHNIAF